MDVLKLSVTQFAQRSVLVGDIDMSLTLTQVDAQIGIELHHKIQRKREKVLQGYRSEVPAKHTFDEPLHNLQIKISGRIDGQWIQDDILILEEIKSTYNVKKLIKSFDRDPEHPYLLQLKLYAWIKSHSLDESQIKAIEPHLLLVAAGSEAETVYPVDFDKEEMDAWIVRKLEWVEANWRAIETFRGEQKTRGKKLKFPYSKKRPGQVALVQDVTDVCDKGGALLAQAPTGIGKTAAVLIPLLKESLSKGDKLFHITPKNSQLREAEKLFAALHKKGSSLKAMLMTSKAKICMQDEVDCNPERCKFAKGHFDKVAASDLVDQLNSEPLINQSLLREYAVRYEVCPYELGKQVMPWRDVVAGDYHYALSPNATFIETAAFPLPVEQKPFLSIDEAHNLAERALDWYSGAVTKIPVDAFSFLNRKLKKILSSINHWFDLHMERVGPKNRRILDLDRTELAQIVDRWNLEMPKILERHEESGDIKPLMNVWFEWLNFAALLEMPENLFFIMADFGPHRMTIHCANAGPLISGKLNGFASVVAFSATLKPFDYHLPMCGFNKEKTKTKEYTSSFPAENRRIIAIPQVSTAWKDRASSIPKIADVINRVSKLKKGNYIAFFPSFELLRQTRPLISSESLEIREQPSRATPSWTRSILKDLKTKRGILLLAVQGGILSEGIDLPGESLICAFIVGPALPMMTAEREERRRLLHDLYGDGFSFAYIHPAMARSVQSAGRVVRTPKDRGLVLLLDPRFLNPQYASSMPQDWLSDNAPASSLMSTSILSDIELFWNG
jgi:DNA excision repair protein ERCC-2